MGIAKRREFDKYAKRIKDEYIEIRTCKIEHECTDWSYWKCFDEVVFDLGIIRKDERIRYTKHEERNKAKFRSVDTAGGQTYADNIEDIEKSIFFIYEIGNLSNFIKSYFRDKQNYLIQFINVLAMLHGVIYESITKQTNEKYIVKSGIIYRSNNEPLMPLFEEWERKPTKSWLKENIITSRPGSGVATHESRIKEYKNDNELITSLMNDLNNCKDDLKIAQNTIESYKEKIKKYEQNEEQNKFQNGQVSESNDVISIETHLNKIQELICDNKIKIKNIEDNYKKTIEKLEEYYKSEIDKKKKNDKQIEGLIQNASKTILENKVYKAIMFITSLIDTDYLEGASIDSLGNFLSKVTETYGVIKNWISEKGMMGNNNIRFDELIQRDDDKITEKVNTIMMILNSKSWKETTDRVEVAVIFAFSGDTHSYKVIDNKVVNTKSSHNQCSLLFELNGINHTPSSFREYKVTTKGLAKLQNGVFVPYKSGDKADDITFQPIIEISSIFEDIINFIDEIDGIEDSKLQVIKSLKVFMNQANTFAEKELSKIKNDHEEFISWAKKYRSLIEDVFFRNYEREFDKIIGTVLSGINSSQKKEVREELQNHKENFLNEWNEIKNRLNEVGINTHQIVLGDEINIGAKAKQGWDIAIISDDIGKPDTIGHIEHNGIEIKGVTLIPPKIKVYGKKAKGARNG